ncbi:MAG: hypothetical protein RLZZ28_1985 [Bacteroidota bacterium]
MNIRINFIWISVLVFLFSSCKKVVELDLSNNAERLVIEGNITNQPGPYFIRLTRSVNFNEPNNYPPVLNAQVIVSDNTNQRDTLTYSGNGYYKTNGLKGVEGRTYFLSVLAEGKKYTAESSMPAAVKLDSLVLSYFTANGKDRINVIPLYTDPVMLGNSYRFIQKVNNKPDETYYAFNDNLNNGLTNQRPLRSNDPDLDLVAGDLVQIEMQCISRETFSYFYSLSQQARNGFSGGTAPVNPPNNLSGDALGIFSAHTTQTRTVLIR